jgi:hypothetical protein
MAFFTVDSTGDPKMYLLCAQVKFPSAWQEESRQKAQKAEE